MVPPSSHGIPRVPWYSGSCRPGSASPTRLSRSPVCFPTHFGSLPRCLLQSETPVVFLPPVWPLPRSLATTGGISVDFSSSPYLDVSVQAVPLFLALLRCFSSGGSPHIPMDSVYDAGALVRRIAPFGYLRIVSYLLIPAAFRSLSRPSSALSAKAFTLRSF